MQKPDSSLGGRANERDVEILRDALTQAGFLPTATTFQWLIERGQPEGQDPTVWASHDDRGKPWVTDAWKASMFPSRAEAEAYIYEHFTHPTRGASAHAVEHGFTSGDLLVEAAFERIATLIEAAS